MASCDPGVGYKGTRVHFFAWEERGGGQGFESAAVSVWRVLFGFGKVGDECSVAPM
jgi:hypothetical protein